MTKYLDYDGLKTVIKQIKSTYLRSDGQYEANLKWGGKNFTGSYGPIDAAMVPYLGANRFAFADPKGVKAEYSNDGGSTWKDYGASDSAKKYLFGTLSGGFIIGKTKSSTPANDMLRVTIDTSTETGISCYSILNKFCIYCSTNGSQGCYCTIQKALQSTPSGFTDVVTKVPIAGWSGYNIINTSDITTYGNSPSSQYGRLRFIFGCTGNTTTYAGLGISSIMAFGGVGWNVPSNMAKNGHLYTWDYNQNATFPGEITASKFNGKATSAGTADKVGTTDVGGSGLPIYLSSGTPKACSTTLSVNITGNAGTVNGHTVKSDVPENAVFTDMKGATSATTGTHGLVPAPSKGQQDYYLRGDGTWGKIETAKTAESATSATSAGSAKTSETSAKLGTSGNPISAGSATLPVYFSGGTPVACSDTLNVSITGSASYASDANHAASADSASSLPVKGGSANIDKVLLVGNYAGGPVYSGGGGIGPGDFTPSGIITYSGDTKTGYYLMTVSSATTASKIGTGTTGGASKPVYIKDGVPTACSYTIEKSVPPTANFNDTTYKISQGDNRNEITLSGTSGLTTTITINNVEKAKSLSGSCGSVTQPVFFTTGGTPSACTYTLNSSVPENAVFTDKYVYQKIDSASTSDFPLMLSPLSEDTKVTNSGFTDSALINLSISANPKNGTIKSPHFSGSTFSGTTFYGNLSGNASSASSATSAGKVNGTLTINGTTYNGSKDVTINISAGSSVDRIADSDITSEVNKAISWT